MKVTGEHLFAAKKESVWAALLDAEVLGRTIPGGEALERVGENEFAGKMKVKVGPVSGRFDGTVQLENLRPPDGYEMVIKGQGPLGFVRGSGEMGLSEETDGTRLSYDLDLKIGGRIASVGQRLLDSSAKVLTRQALENLERQIEARESAGESGAAVPPPSAPTQAHFAAQFASGLLGELVPPHWRPPIVIGAIVVLLLILFKLFVDAG